MRRNFTEIPSAQDDRSMELWHLCVAAYYRVSTDLEEQTSSIELLKRYYTRRICQQMAEKKS